MKIVMTMHAYATKSQSLEAVRDMLRLLEVAGYRISKAEADTITVTAKIK